MFEVVNPNMSPFPEAVNPILGVLLVHEYVVTPPVLFELKLISVVLSPVQTDISEGVFT